MLLRLHILPRYLSKGNRVEPCIRPHPLLGYGVLHQLRLLVWWTIRPYGYSIEELILPPGLLYA